MIGCCFISFLEENYDIQCCSKCFHMIALHHICSMCVITTCNHFLHVFLCTYLLNLIISILVKLAVFEQKNHQTLLDPPGLELKITQTLDPSTFSLRRIECLSLFFFRTQDGFKNNNRRLNKPDITPLDFCLWGYQSIRISPEQSLH